ncbi:MAG TPA: transglycosylase SLT domain-containing protein [Micropepsaceae bacterium]|nr:transglycosylase SLT domain-containing protein [Micropepsaceae bacterium]
MISDTQSVTATGHTDVLAALRAASSKTGLDFDFLLHTAMRESSLNVQAKSKTSSASGLFQFVEQTWLGLIKRYGERYGLGSFANSIQQGSDGHYAVASPQTKSAILALRQDPELSALMAGEGAKQTKQTLECALGRQVCGGELYAAHFLGPSGARHLIELKERNPDTRADLAFPQAAKGNKSAFYHADGTAKTVGEVYAWAVDAPDAQTPTTATTTFVVAPPQSQPQMVAANFGGVDPDSLFAALNPPEHSEIAAMPASDADNVFPSVRRPAIDSPSVPSMTAMAAQVVPQSSVLLAPGVLQMLATLSPAKTRQTA